MLEVVSLEAPESLLSDDDVRLHRVTETLASVLLRATTGPAAQPLLYAIGLKARGMLPVLHLYFNTHLFVICALLTRVFLFRKHRDGKYLPRRTAGTRSRYDGQSGPA